MLSKIEVLPIQCEFAHMLVSFLVGTEGETQG